MPRWNIFKLSLQRNSCFSTFSRQSSFFLLSYYFTELLQSMRSSFTHFIIRTPRPSPLSPVTLCFKNIKNIRFFWICKSSSMSKSITIIMFSIPNRNTWTLESKCSKFYSFRFILSCLRIKYNIFWTHFCTVSNSV